MRVTVLLFAQLRRAAERDRVVVEVGDDATVRAVAEHLERELDLREGGFSGSMCAVNQRYAAPGTKLVDGDVLAFLPPVSGG